VLEDVVAQVIAYLVRFPLGAAEQVLEPVRCSMAGVLGELPGVLPSHRTEQAACVITSASTCLYPTEPARDTGEQVVELRRPLVDLDGYTIHKYYSIKQSSKTQTTTVV
jgi:hypothetical protein